MQCCFLFVGSANGLSWWIWCPFIHKFIVVFGQARHGDSIFSVEVQKICLLMDFRNYSTIKPFSELLKEKSQALEKLASTFSKWSHVAFPMCTISTNSPLLREINQNAFLNFITSFPHAAASLRLVRCLWPCLNFLRKVLRPWRFPPHL